MGYSCRALQRTPRLDLVEPGAALAIDCEGVMLTERSGRDKNGLGDVAIVNERGEVILHTYADHSEPHRPPPQRLNLGVRYKDIRPENGAVHIDQVTQMVTRILDRAGIVVGHAIANDMNMLRDVPWERYQTADTQTMHWPQTCSKGLKQISKMVLRRDIQGLGHSSVEDARATMDLYLLQRNAKVDPHGSGISSESESASDLALQPGFKTEGSAITVANNDAVVNQALRAHRALLPRRILDTCHRVALPNLKGLAKGRSFDLQTSTYY